MNRFLQTKLAELIDNFETETLELIKDIFAILYSIDYECVIIPEEYHKSILDFSEFTAQGEPITEIWLHLSEYLLLFVNQDVEDGEQDEDHHFPVSLILDVEDIEVENIEDEDDWEFGYSRPKFLRFSTDAVNIYFYQFLEPDGINEEDLPFIITTNRNQKKRLTKDLKEIFGDTLHENEVPAARPLIFKKLFLYRLSLFIEEFVVKYPEFKTTRSLEVKALAHDEFESFEPKFKKWAKKSLNKPLSKVLENYFTIQAR